MSFRSPHIAIVAGEPSGDWLAADLVTALKKRLSDVWWSGVAGQAMQQAGVRSLIAIERLSVMGLVEVIQSLPDLFSARAELLDYWRSHPPDLFIGVDAPDFNLRLAHELHRNAIPTVHYVSPSLWAWKEKRIHRIKHDIDLMLCLFPFETAVYDRHGVKALCVGHSARDRLALLPLSQNQPGQSSVIGIFAGSRKSEMNRLLPVFLEAFALMRQQYPGLQASVSVSAAHYQRLVESVVSGYGGVEISSLPAAELMRQCDLALLASGTVTLEAALLNLPMVVAYRVNPFTAMIVKRLLKIDRFALPNLLAGRDSVPEHIQGQATPANIAQSALYLLEHPQAVLAQRTQFDRIRAVLPEKAADRAADAICTRFFSL